MFWNVVPDGLADTFTSVWRLSSPSTFSAEMEAADSYKTLVTIYHTTTASSQKMVIFIITA
jgi:hypothetical protein